MYESPLEPVRQLLFLLLSPVIVPVVVVYWALEQWRCRRDGGHEWDGDWGSDTPSWGTVVKEYDYCLSCPASRTRDPREVED